MFCRVARVCCVLLLLTKSALLLHEPRKVFLPLATQWISWSLILQACDLSGKAMLSRLLHHPSKHCEFWLRSLLMQDSKPWVKRNMKCEYNHLSTDRASQPVGSPKQAMLLWDQHYTHQSLHVRECCNLCEWLCACSWTDCSYLNVLIEGLCNTDT